VLSIPRYIVYPGIAAVTYAALYWLAERAVFFPDKYPEGAWDLQAELGAIDVWLTTRDHIRIHAWQVDQPGARFVTLFFHGNAGNLTHRYPHFREISSAGSSILMIDYRGYGKSSGRPSELGLYTDACTAYDHLIRKGSHPRQIVLHGESLGTAVAVYLAAHRPCGGLILEAPFTSARDVAQTVFPVIGPLLIRSFNLQQSINRIRTPALFIQGDRDEVILPALGQALYAEARGPKSLWIVPGAHHNDIIETAGIRYRQRLHEFYESLPY
jgi:fermentation-respiration switch protein FrsA (DUF1100 family)